MKDQQLEIGLDGANKAHRVYHSQRRRQRAKWWFQQMRLAVEAVTGGQAAVNAPPEQIYFPLMH